MRPARAERSPAQCAQAHARQPVSERGKLRLRPASPLRASAVGTVSCDDGLSPVLAGPVATSHVWPLGSEMWLFGWLFDVVVTGSGFRRRVWLRCWTAQVQAFQGNEVAASVQSQTLRPRTLPSVTAALCGRMRPEGFPPRESWVNLPLTPSLHLWAPPHLSCPTAQPPSSLIPAILPNHLLKNANQIMSLLCQNPWFPFALKAISKPLAPVPKASSGLPLSGPLTSAPTFLSRAHEVAATTASLPTLTPAPGLGTCCSSSHHACPHRAGSFSAVRSQLPHHPSDTLPPAAALSAAFLSRRESFSWCLLLL